MCASKFVHVDVFTQMPFSGNSLTVFPAANGLTGAQMALITKELRHFESIFLTPAGDSGVVRARVFDLMGELDFAGHPILGAAAVLHAQHGDATDRRWTFQLNARTVEVETRREPTFIRALLDQGTPEYIGVLPPTAHQRVAAALHLPLDALHPALPLEVVSTGLRYLIVPLARGLELARIVDPQFEALLGGFGAEFAYLLDVEQLEGRHWNNDGVVEDVATGSGAGCVAAYLRRHGRIADGEERILRQGRFVGRPSGLRISAHGPADAVRSVTVGGDVAMVGEGVLRALPPANSEAA